MERQHHQLAQLFTRPVIRGTRITRLEEKKLGQFHLTAEEAYRLGIDNVGLFIGNCGNYERAMTLVERLSNTSNEGKWLVVLSSKMFAESVYRQTTDDHWTKLPPRVWEVQQTVFCVPESLEQLENVIDVNQIAGIVILDLNCRIHKARGFYSNNFRVDHDRPQKIVNFRASLTALGWAPPLVFLAKQPAKSINTEPIIRTFCLEAVKYLDGRTIRMGDPPANVETSSSSATRLVLRVG